MILRRSFVLRVGLTLLAPALALAVLLPAGPGNVLTGCGPCTARLASTIVQPPQPPESCLEFNLSVCNLGGETLEVNNSCVSPLTLTSSFFLPEGKIGAEAGTGQNVFVVPQHSLKTFVAGPNATGSYVLSLSGTIDGAPIEVTFYLTSGLDGGGSDAVVDVEAGPATETGPTDSAPPVDTGKPTNKHDTGASSGPPDTGAVDASSGGDSGDGAAAETGAPQHDASVRDARKG